MAPDSVPAESVQAKVAQAGVLGSADPVLGAGAVTAQEPKSAPTAVHFAEMICHTESKGPERGMPAAFGLAGVMDSTQPQRSWRRAYYGCRTAHCA
jgi:hypothetical protein